MITIDYKSGQPIYEQIILSVKRDAARGIMKPGEALPSVRQLAGELGINPNTVAKAYQELERQGAIVTAKGKGAYISDTKPGYTPSELAKWKDALRRILVEMRCAGVDEGVIADIINGRDDGA